MGSMGKVMDVVSRRWWLTALIAAVVVFLLMQLVPIRVSNPPVTSEPNWDSPQTRALAVKACFDCHSNESKPYAWEKIAPLSWWISGHVSDGRAALNFSEWNTGGKGETGDIIETVKNGSMPPSYYTWLGLHSGAKLTAAEQQQLADGLKLTLAQSGGTSRGGG